MDKKYSVDEIINDKVVLENVDTGEIIVVDLKDIPGHVHDGSILLYDGRAYQISLDEEEFRRRKIRERIEKLKALKNNDK